MLAMSHCHGTMCAMRATIDKAGRLVIPRALRNRIGLAAGGEVNIDVVGASIRIEPVVGGELRDDGGLLLIPATGISIDDNMVRELIDADRHGR
jgi:AbrB family looped-hinge helix DNA binding protein